MDRWFCSNMHFESQPSRLRRLLSSHCSLPSRMPLPQMMVVQAVLHIEPGGSHCSLPVTQPSPHVSATQVPPMHTPPVHKSHVARGGAVPQAWPSCPFTMTSWQGSAPLQSFISEQLAAVVQENWQFTS